MSIKDFSALSICALALITSVALAPAMAEDASKKNAKPNAEQQLPEYAKSPTYSAYMADLQRRIKRAWFPPKAAETRQTKVTFTVQKNGQMTDLAVSKSSGLQIVDNAAKKAVENAAPYRPLPDTFPSEIKLEMTFDYNLFNSNGNTLKQL